MATSESNKQAHYKYAKANIKRIPLDMKLDQYDQIKAAADAANEPVNTYIKKAIAMRMESEQQ